MRDNATVGRAEADIQEKLEALVSAISKAERNEHFIAEYIKLPADRPHGKSFGYFVFNDLLRALSYATNKMEPRDIPDEPYRTLLHARDNHPVTSGAAHQYIMNEHQNPASEKLPEDGLQFVGIFGDRLQQAAQEVMLDVIPHWEALATSLAASIDKKVFPSVHDRMNRYIEHMKKAFDNALEPRKMTDDKKDNNGPFNSPELNNLMDRAESMELPAAVLKRFMADFKRMDGMREDSSDYRGKLQPLLVMLELPWNQRAELQYGMKETQTRMNKKHTGLEKAKEIVLEHLAVQFRTGKPNGKILCFDGAPGIGKTSLVKTIAYATGRPLVRISLGGLYDSTEIRGHRSTYANAEAGRIIHALIEAGVKNPIIQLDEIDKISTHGNNAAVEAALLEVLDPEQNTNFRDSFLEVDFDLGEVTFIATSNDKNQIMPALRDRMEVVDLLPYTAAQKLEIAQNHLLHQQMKENGVDDDNVHISTSVLKLLIDNHVREPGVRGLDRLIEKLCRKAAYKLESGQAESVFVTEKNLYEFLDRPHHSSNLLTRENSVGIVNGLAVAGHMGLVLPFEVIKMPSVSGKFTVMATGQMKESMKESTSVITSWIRANAEKYGIKQEDLDKIELHIDAVSDGPKDGPSAGAAILTACMSVLTNTPIRADVAMTGKMSLGGRILAIGGTLAKLEGAMREGITTVLIPANNAIDLKNASDEIKSLNIVQVRTMDDVLKNAFAKPALLKLECDYNQPPANDTRDAPAEKPPTEAPAMHQGLLAYTPKAM